MQASNVEQAYKPERERVAVETELPSLPSSITRSLRHSASAPIASGDLTRSILVFLRRRCHFSPIMAT